PRLERADHLGVPILDLAALLLVTLLDLLLLAVRVGALRRNGLLVGGLEHPDLLLVLLEDAAQGVLVLVPELLDLALPGGAGGGPRLILGVAQRLLERLDGEAVQGLELRQLQLVAGAGLLLALGRLQSRGRQLVGVAARGLLMQRVLLRERALLSLDL